MKQDKNIVCYCTYLDLTGLISTYTKCCDWRNYFLHNYFFRLLILSLIHTYEADADASVVSMRRTINFVVKQTQTVHT